jgi:hypothetical protein
MGSFCGASAVLFSSGWTSSMGSFGNFVRSAAVLGAGDFDIAIAGVVLAHGDDGIADTVEGLVEAGGEEAGLEA